MQAKVTLGPTGATIWLKSTATPEMFGVLEQCKRIIWRHSRNLGIAVVGWYLGGILAIIVGILFEWTWPSVVASAGILVTLCTLQFYLRRIRFCIITLKYKKDDPSFIFRNRDEIIIGIACTVLGTILGWLLAQGSN